MRASVSLLLLPLLLASSAAAQDIRARVVDDASRQPIAGATATLLSNNSVVTRAATDANGFFRIKPAAAGEYEITVEMLGYATVRRQVSFNGQEFVAPAFVLKAQAIPLDPLEATARRGSDSSAAVVGFARASHVVSGSRMALLEQHAARPITLVREMGLRVREFKLPTGLPYICVEARRGASTIRRADCEWPVIVIDGIKVGDRLNAYETFRDLQIQDMESFEYLPPVEAGSQYGLDASANGALVIWTRGRGPHRNPDRNKR